MTILEAIRSLRSEYLDMTGCPLQNLKKGAYVIRLSDNMSMFYGNRHHSPVIYIGHGSIETRLKKHYEDKLFDFMLSLNGMNFDFYVCEPWKPKYRRTDFHKQIEYTPTDCDDPVFVSQWMARGGSLITSSLNGCGGLRNTNASIRTPSRPAQDGHRCLDGLLQ